MSFFPTLGSVIDAASGFLLLALGLFVASVGPRRRMNVAFAAFSATFGTAFLLGNLVSLDDPLRPGLDAAMNVLLGASAASLVLLALALPPRPKGKGRGDTALAAGVAILFAASVVGSLGPPRAEAPWVLTLFVVAFRAAFWFILLLLALRFAAVLEPGGARQQRQYALLSLGLLMYPGLNAGLAIHANARTFWVFAPLSGPLWLPLDLLVLVVTGLAVLMLLAALWLRNAARAQGPEARAARNVAFASLLLPLLGLVAASLLGGEPGARNAGPLGIARALTVLVLSYAILKTQLFDIDLRLKRTLRESTVVLAFFTAFLVTYEATRRLAPDAAPYLGIAAAALLLLGLSRVQRFADRLAGALMPGVRDARDYLDFRRLEVYRAALEQVVSQDARGPPRDAPVLVSLRQQLGITDREHAVLEYAVRGAGRQRAPLEFAPGTLVLGRYRVVSPLGEGSFGRTYLAEDGVLKRNVVVKALRPERARDPEALERFLREARLLAAAQHPSLVTIYDVERVGEQAFLVMEYVRGGSLADKLRAGPLPEPEARRVAADMLSGLAAMHERGILHRDVKPKNVLLDERGRAKLCDFGVAREVASGETHGTGDTTGGAVGTLGYMAPEQARGAAVTERSDLYAVGATLYEALTGRPPVELGSAGDFEARLRVLEEQPRLPVPGASARLNRVLARALEKDPSQRFASAEEMRRALEEPGPAPRAA